MYLFLNSFSGFILPTFAKYIICVGVYAGPWVSRSRLLRDGRAAVMSLGNRPSCWTTGHDVKEILVRKGVKTEEKGGSGGKEENERGEPMGEYAYRGKSEMRRSHLCRCNTVRLSLVYLANLLRNCHPLHPCSGIEIHTTHVYMYIYISVRYTFCAMCTRRKNRRKK